SIEYALEKKQVRTLSFPNNESKIESWNAFSQFDYIASARHFVTATVHLSPRHINFVDPRFFDPQPVTPSFKGFERAVAVTDHATVSGVLLDSSVSQQQYNSRIGAQGEAAMVMTPTGDSGNYFARQHRESSRLEWSETLSITKGAHNLKFGVLAARSSMSGGFSFKPVEIRDRDQRLIQRIEFTGGEPYRLTDMEEAFYAQDHFRILRNVTLDGGARLERQAKTATLRFAPRVGAAWTPFGDGNTVFRAGFGVFYDHVPLKVYSFTHYPEQSITNYDVSGAVSDSVRLINLTSLEAGTRYPLLH